MIRGLNPESSKATPELKLRRYLFYFYIIHAFYASAFRLPITLSKLTPSSRSISIISVTAFRASSALRFRFLTQLNCVTLSFILEYQKLKSYMLYDAF